MGLLILIITGALLGWIITILRRVEDGRQIGRYMVWGMVGSVLVGVIVANGLVLGSVSPIALLAGFLGATAFVVAYDLLHRRRIAE